MYYDLIFDTGHPDRCPVFSCDDAKHLTPHVYPGSISEVHATGDLPIPTHLQDAHYKGAAKLGHGTGYKYAHDYPNDYVEQQYLPYELSGREFYQPSGNGYEVKIREHMARIKKEAAEASSENKES